MIVSTAIANRTISFDLDSRRFKLFRTTSFRPEIVRNRSSVYEQSARTDVRTRVCKAYLFIAVSKVGTRARNESEKFVSRIPDTSYTCPGGTSRRAV